MSTMTREQATDQAVKMHNQKIPYAKIAEHLQKAGYISEKTKKPIGHMAVRQMVEAAKAMEKKEAAEDKALFRSAKSDALDGILEVVGLKNLPLDDKLDLIERLCQKARANA